VIAGLAGLDPMPLNLGLLNFRALKSVKYVFGAKMPASLTEVMSSLWIVPCWTVVTLTGNSSGSAGSFWAVTVTGGSVTRPGDAAAWAIAIDGVRTLNRAAPARAQTRRRVFSVC
jgi:hypothetical protein